MKYRLTESQNELILELKKRRYFKEQEHIMQSFSPTANEEIKEVALPQNGSSSSKEV